MGAEGRLKRLRKKRCRKLPTSKTQLLWPFEGRHDGLAAHHQPPTTTREAANVVGVDPVTGRIRGAQRGGYSKLVADDLLDAQSGGSSGYLIGIRELAQIIYDSRLTTYAVNDAEGELEIVWAKAVPSKEQARRVQTDRQFNAYLIAGLNRVVKYNPEGVELAHFEVPVDHEDQDCAALAIDGRDWIYVGVTSGPQGSLGQIFQYRLDDEGDYQLAWSLDLDGFCADIKIHRGLMYFLENIPDTEWTEIKPGPTSRGTASLKVYDSLDASAPRLLWDRVVPYPASALDVADDGSIFAAAFPNATRVIPQPQGECSTASIDWQPTDLNDYSDRIWSWHDARDLTGMAQGQPVTFWPDRSGNVRHLFYEDDYAWLEDHNPPTIDLAGLCEEATVEFNGKHALSTQDTFDGDADNVLSSNLSLMPTVNDHSWTTFVLFIGQARSDERNVLMFQTGAEITYRFEINEGDTPGTPESGQAHMHTNRTVDAALDGSGGSSGGNEKRIDAGAFVREWPPSGGSSGDGLIRNACVMAFRHGGDDVAEGSKFRLNGEQIDSFTLNREQARGPTILGFDDPSVAINDAGDYAGFRGGVAEIITIRDDGSAITTDEIERIEGYLAHKWGVQHQLPAGHTYRSSPPAGPSGPSSGGSSGAVETYAAQLKSDHGIVAKYGPERGRLRWAFAGAGVGFDVALGEGGKLYNIGDVVDTPSGPSSGFSSGPEGAGFNVTMRQIIDGGADYTLGWEVLRSVFPQPIRSVKIAVDGGGNVYAPVSTFDAVTDSIMKFDDTGAKEWGLTSPAGLGWAVALDTRSVDYNDDTIDEPEFLYFTKDQGGEGETAPTLRKLRLVRATQTTGVPRAERIIAVAGGDIKVVDRVAGSVSTPTGGSAALDRASQWVQAVILFGEAFCHDGEDMVVYKAGDDEVVDYEPTGPGEFPKRPRLLSRWSGALWAARFDDNPHNWFMTKRGDPYDVDLFPPVINATQAVKGNDSRVGVCPDIVNSLIPYDDDLALFGGDSSIHRLTGDPAAGGRFDLVTDITGIAFGRAWCKDPAGVLYFLGSKGGLYRMVPGSVPEDVSDAKLDRALKDIDLSIYRVEMGWNHRARGINIWMLPLAEHPGGGITHFFYEMPTGAFYDVTFGDETLEPTAFRVIDGDDYDDRISLIGCRDGHLRYYDETADDDDSTAIAASVVMGPFMVAEDRRIQASEFEIKLDRDQDGATLEIMATDTPETVPSVQFTKALSAGRNAPFLERVTGQSVFVRLKNLSAGERFAYEAGSFETADAGEIKE